MLACVLGFLLTLSFQTVSHPKQRDSQNVWQLREALSKQKMRTKKLNDERRRVEQLLTEYQHNPNQGKEETMKKALHELKKQAGLTKVSGQGITIHVEPLISGSLIGQNYHPVTARLLQTLVNELNSFGAGQIAIAGQRIIAASPIRDVNGEVYVNDHRIPEVPFTIKVLSNHPKELHNEMMVSDTRREFAEAKLNLTSEAVRHLTLPAYKQPIFVQYMEPVKENS